MTAARDLNVETRSKSNAKLLKALIVALALKDEALLDDLREVFTAASIRGNDIGKADAEVWKEINRRLLLIEDLVAEDGHLFDQNDGGDGDSQGGVH